MATTQFLEIRMRARFSFIAASALVAAMSACASDNAINNTDQCNIKLVTVTPDNPSLVSGHTLALHAAYTAGISAACTPSVPASSLIWVSTNPALLSVDPATGVVTGISAGMVSVTLHLPGSTSSIASVVVNVTAQ
jgi:uncharacterized protein YjdB